MRVIEMMENTFESEAVEIAIYLAMSRQAEEEGHPDIASYLYSIAMDEAGHAAEFALLLGKIKDTRTNLKVMLEDEIKTEKEKADAAKIAQYEGNEAASEFFEKAMHDETRHKEGIRKVLLKLLEKY